MHKRRDFIRNVRRIKRDSLMITITRLSLPVVSTGSFGLNRKGGICTSATRQLYNEIRRRFFAPLFTVCCSHVAVRSRSRSHPMASLSPFVVRHFVSSRPHPPRTPEATRSPERYLMTEFSPGLERHYSRFRMRRRFLEGPHLNCIHPSRRR